MVGIVFGGLFPYQSMSLIWISSILLFLLLFLNTLAVEPGQLTRAFARKWPEAGAVMVLIFLFFPLLLAAASRLLLKDQDFAFGMVVSALAPCALVNPFFARLRGGDGPLSLVNVILSTLLCPFVTVPMLRWLGYESVYLDSRYTLVFLVSLTVLPVLFSFIVVALWPKLSARSLPYLPYMNSLILAVLMFILVGSSVRNLPLRFLIQGDLPVLVVIFLVADFGFYLLIRACAGLFTGAVGAETLALSVSSRNFAVSASLMLFFHPKAALPAAVGLAVHALFFQFLTWKKRGAAIPVVCACFLIFTPPARAAGPPVYLKIRFCLPAYGECTGTTAALAARDLSYFGRESLETEIFVIKGSILKAVSEGKCDAALVSIHEMAALGKSDLKKWRPLYYFLPGDGGGPRVLSKAGAAFTDFKKLGGKTIRAADRFAAAAVERQMAEMDLHKPRMVIQPDTSLAATDLLAGKIDAAVIEDPAAGGLLTSLKFWNLPSDIQGLNDRAAAETPSAFIVTAAGRMVDPALGAFLKAYVGAFAYLDLNPTENMRMLQNNRQFLGLKQDLPAVSRLIFSVNFFTWPKMLPATELTERKKILKVLKTRRPNVHDWLESL